MGSRKTQETVTDVAIAAIRPLAGGEGLAVVLFYYLSILTG
jgi:hypothetical protein